MSSSTNRRVSPRLIALLLVALVALAILAHRALQSGFDWHRFWATFGRLDLLWLFLAALMILTSYLGRALRWQVMMRPVAPHCRLSVLLAATVIGFTAVVFFGRPGEIVRPYLIATREKVSLSSQLAAWFLERVYDLLAVIFILGVGLSRVHDSGHLSPALTWMLRAGGNIAAIFGGASIVLLILIHHYTDWAQRRLTDALAFLPEPTYRRVTGSLNAFMTGFRSTGSLPMVAEIALYTVLEWILIYLGFLFCLKALPETAALSPGDGLALMGAIALGGIIQIPGIGGGMQVVAVMALTELFGVAMEPASGVAILLWLVSWVSVVPIGLAVAVHQGLNWNKLKHLDQTPTL
jgi:glycosyltransferase 2 family protein